MFPTTMPGKKFIRFPILLLLLLTLAASCTAPQPSPTPAQPTAAPAEPPPVSFSEMSEAELAEKIISLVTAAEDEARTLATAESSALPEKITQAQSTLAHAQEALNIYTSLFTAVDPAGESAAMLDVVTAQLADTASRLTQAQEILSAQPLDSAALSVVLKALKSAPTLREVLRAFRQQVTDQIEQRETYYMNIAAQPGQVADNRVEAFIQAHDFLDAARAALTDARFSAAELENLSQAGANAEASLYNTGSPPLFVFARQIDQITRQAVRGEWPAAQAGLFELQRSLPARPEG